MILFNNNKNIKETTPQYVYRVLKENIMNLNLRPGDAISETEISQRLNVSRTPVREAISYLKQENLIEVYPNIGTFVSLINPALVNEAQFMRTVLECEVIKLACKTFSKENLKKLEDNLILQEQISEFNFSPYEYFKLDNEFHKIIFDSCDKSTVWEYVVAISSHLNRVRLLDAKNQPATKITHKQHHKILEIIKDKQINEADLFIKKHVASFKDRYEELFKAYPNFFKI